MLRMKKRSGARLVVLSGFFIAGGKAPFPTLSLMMMHMWWKKFELLLFINLDVCSRCKSMLWAIRPSRMWRWKARDILWRLLIRKMLGIHNPRSSVHDAGWLSCGGLARSGLQRWYILFKLQSLTRIIRTFLEKVTQLQSTTNAVFTLISRWGVADVKYAFICWLSFVVKNMCDALSRSLVELHKSAAAIWPIWRIQYWRFFFSPPRVVCVWNFPAAPFFFAGGTKKLVPDSTATRQDCATACELESAFSCVSFAYHTSGTCILSSVNQPVTNKISNERGLS